MIFLGKPRSYYTNMTLGVTDTTGIEFSVIVVAYPEPQYELQFENGTKNSQMTGSITSNSVNNFTIQFNQTAVEQSDYGTYRLRVNNSFGYTTLFLNVIPQSKSQYVIYSHTQNYHIKCFDPANQWFQQIFLHVFH